ncbi:MAG TPA: Lrp/AsnC family transcriptional regulator [Thermomicrobiaceae bacterium]|nr:Lrp/AsnC family transcriptional regulator [Thermomicrobiaceae bacterium]
MRIPGSSRLDEADRAIIHALQEDGRLPVSTIAEAIGLPASTVRRRINRLQSDGTLRIVAIADNERLGLPVHVVIRVETDVASGDSVGRALDALDEVRWVAMVAGQSDYLVEAFFASNAHLHAFLVNVLAGIPGIQRTETMAVVNLSKNSYRWSTMLRSAAEAPAAARRGS